MSRRRRQRETEPRSKVSEEERVATSRLYSWLADGGALYPRPSSLILKPGELVYADMHLTVGRYHAVDVTYQTGSHVVLGPPALAAISMLTSAARNNRARRDAENLARPQWRTATHRALLTNYTMTYVSPQGWVEFGHSHIRELFIDPGEQVVVEATGCPPLGLFGPGSTWFGVAWASLVFDLQRFSELPALQQFRLDPALYH